jgi:hypothetical protein
VPRTASRQAADISAGRHNRQRDARPAGRCRRGADAAVAAGDDEPVGARRRGVLDLVHAEAQHVRAERAQALTALRRLARSRALVCHQSDRRPRLRQVARRLP